MTRVFVSHCSEDYYFVDFLTELLKFHHVDVWVDRSSLEAGGEFPSDIEQALATCGALIIVISQHSPKSRWMAREVSHFRAVNADRPLIPLVLDAAADPDKVYEGLGVITQLRFYESFLEGFRKLLQLLSRNLFPYVENRQIPDRRSAERRVSGDRRKVAIQPESGLHCGRARLPADAGCVRRRVGVAGAAVRGGAMGARLRAGARGRR